MNNLPELDKELKEGAVKASAIGNAVLERVKLKLGYQYVESLRFNFLNYYIQL